MITTSRNRLKKVVRDFAHTRRMIKNLYLIEPHDITLAHPDNIGEDILEAQKLHASVYLRRGFVDEHDIRGGRLTLKADPHQQHSLYFILRKSLPQGGFSVAATARQIYFHPDKGFMSFPMVEKADLNLQMLKELVSHDPAKCVEISGLAKHRDTSSSALLLLYRAMWHYSLEHEHQLWVMACDVRLYRRLRILFGPAIKKIGKETIYKGGNVIPSMLSPQKALSEFIRISRRRAWMFGISRRDLVSFFIEGLPRKKIPPAELRYIESVLGRK